jgi:hypothetical protein
MSKKALLIFIRMILVLALAFTGLTLVVQGFSPNPNTVRSGAWVALEGIIFLAAIWLATTTVLKLLKPHQQRPNRP